MMVIDLTQHTKEPIAGHTSKGDQPKWHIRDEWYKADHMGYEGLAEVLVSWMLAHSTVTDFVHYDPVAIKTDRGQIQGCRSENFRRTGETLLPLEKLHRVHYGIGLARKLSTYEEVEDKIQYTVTFVEKNTGLKEFGPYLSTLLELDAFVLNEDRHTNNLAVIRNEKTKQYRLCPIFDNGLSFLSDYGDYPLNRDVYECVGAVKAKPFAQDFALQAQAASNLYVSCLKFHFTKEQLHQKLKEMTEYYSPEVVARVERVVLEQMRKYSYLFK